MRFLTFITPSPTSLQSGGGEIILTWTFFVQGSCGGPCGALPPNPSKSCIFEVHSNPNVEAMDIKPILNDFADTTILGPRINVNPATTMV